MNSQLLLAQLAPLLNNSSTVTLPYSSFKLLYNSLSYNIEITKQIQNLKKSIENFNYLRKNMGEIKSSVNLTASFLSKSLFSIAKEFTSLRGNYLYILIHLSNSLLFMREQLVKVVELIENSIYAFNKDAKNSSTSNGFYSRTLVLLKPIKQFIEATLQKINATDTELKSAELAKGLPFSTLTKEKSDMNTCERKMVDMLLKDQTVDVKFLKQRLKSAHTISKEKLNDPTPPSDASCTVTELEDFLYNLLHGKKESITQHFTKDVCLKDLLAITREVEDNAEASPICTTAGCLKDIEAIVKPVKLEFDPKKVKKIEFSDNKIAEQLEEIKNPSNKLNNDSIDEIALSTALRNQSIKEILRYEDYAKQCKDNEVVQGKIILESFDLPDERPEDYPSLKSTQEIVYKKPLKQSKPEKSTFENYRENSKSEKKSGVKELKKKHTEAGYWANKDTDNDMKKSISLLSINDSIDASSDKNECNKGSDNGKSLKVLKRKTEEGIIKLPILNEDKRDHLSVKALKRILEKASEQKP